MARTILFSVTAGCLLTFLTFRISACLKPEKQQPQPQTKCREFTSVTLCEPCGVTAIFRHRYCGDAGTISIQSNKPIFDLKATSRIMATDNVVGLDGVGYGLRMDTDADKRTVMIKWQTDCAAIEKVVDSIIYKL